MKLSDREYELITNALYIMEGQCIGDELDYEIEEDLDGTPDPEEVRELMYKLEKEQFKNEK